MKRKAPEGVKAQTLRLSEPPAAPNALDAVSPMRPCPICGKPAVIKMQPFCSKRCADIDLHRWLGGTYAIPAVEKNDDDPTDKDNDA